MPRTRTVVPSRRPRRCPGPQARLFVAATLAEVLAGTVSKGSAQRAVSLAHEAFPASAPPHGRAPAARRIGGAHGTALAALGHLGGIGVLSPRPDLPLLLFSAQLLVVHLRLGALLHQASLSRGVCSDRSQSRCLSLLFCRHAGDRLRTEQKELRLRRL